MKPDDLTELMRWYASNCNGEWEHQYGVSIETLDNPGWSVEIDLADTALQAKSFTAIEQQRSTEDWLRCWVESSTFRAVGGPSNLGEMLRVFLEWKSEQ